MPARLRIMDKHLGNIAMFQRQRLAARPQLLPSQISAAVKVANIVGDDNKAAETVIRAVDNSMKLLQQEIELQNVRPFELLLVMDSKVRSTVCYCPTGRRRKCNWAYR